ncbi:hypothetical protein M9H77_37110 [Catharanthus roseus]|uniref:Uncharacterized protein n=1 Tax=Catharanthus roseus TaxID=4058 RepID=A0ACB9ZUL2_CATRO|nr:hypothetical protein M9H77_37110 [Catharanthus roseus]
MAAFNLLPLYLTVPTSTSLSRFTCQVTKSPSAAVHIGKPPEQLPTSLHQNPNPNSNFPPSLTCALQCSHFESCSGCTHEYNLHRPDIVDEATDFFEKLGVSDFTFDSCRLWGWRCRAKLAVRGSSTKPLIGLYVEGTHNVVDIPDCKAHHPSINVAVELLKRGIIEANIEPYDEDRGTGELRYVQMAVTTYDTSLPTSQRYKNGKVQVSLVWNSRNENSPGQEKLNALAYFLWRNGGPKTKTNMIHSVWANFQTSTNNIIFGNRWRHLFGENDFWEHVGGIDVSLAPSSFGQANTRAFDSLLRKLQKYVPYGTSVTDLYAGAGVIGLSLAATRKCRSIKCVEVNKESKLSFEKTVERLPSILNCNISWHQADTSVDPISWIVGSDVVVVDPPRKGLEPSLVSALQMSTRQLKRTFSESPSAKAKSEKRPWILRAKEASIQYKSIPEEEERQSLPGTLIYVSCGWHSFKEDCLSLVSGKTWHLEKAHGFNFFPGTESIEILAVFKRGARATKKAGKKKRR